MQGRSLLYQTEPEASKADDSTALTISLACQGIIYRGPHSWWVCSEDGPEMIQELKAAQSKDIPCLDYIVTADRCLNDHLISNPKLSHDLSKVLDENTPKVMKSTYASLLEEVKLALKDVKKLKTALKALFEGNSRNHLDVLESTFADTDRSLTLYALFKIPAEQRFLRQFMIKITETSQILSALNGTRPLKEIEGNIIDALKGVSKSLQKRQMEIRKAANARYKTRASQISHLRALMINTLSSWWGAPEESSILTPDKLNEWIQRESQATIFLSDHELSALAIVNMRKKAPGKRPQRAKSSFWNFFCIPRATAQNRRRDSAHSEGLHAARSAPRRAFERVGAYGTIVSDGQARPIERFSGSSIIGSTSIKKRLVEHSSGANSIQQRSDLRARVHRGNFTPLSQHQSARSATLTPRAKGRTPFEGSASPGRLGWQVGYDAVVNYDAVVQELKEKISQNTFSPNG